MRDASILGLYSKLFLKGRRIDIDKIGFYGTNLSFVIDKETVDTYDVTSTHFSGYSHWEDRKPKSLDYSVYLLPHNNFILGQLVSVNSLVTLMRYDKVLSTKVIMKTITRNTAEFRDGTFNG